MCSRRDRAAVPSTRSAATASKPGKVTWRSAGLESLQVPGVASDQSTRASALKKWRVLRLRRRHAVEAVAGRAERSADRWRRRSLGRRTGYLRGDGGTTGVTMTPARYAVDEEVAVHDTSGEDRDRIRPGCVDLMFVCYGSGRPSPAPPDGADVVSARRSDRGIVSVWFVDSTDWVRGAVSSKARQFALTLR